MHWGVVMDDFKLENEEDIEELVDMLSDLSSEEIDSSKDFFKVLARYLWHLRFESRRKEGNTPEGKNDNLVRAYNSQQKVLMKTKEELVNLKKELADLKKKDGNS